MSDATAPARTSTAAGRAVNCLGVGTSELAGRRLSVDGKRFVGLAVGRLTALIRAVELRDWEPETLAHLRTDRTWLAEQADLRERVLDRAMAFGAIVPVPLLTVYRDTAELSETFRRDADRWRRLLTKLGGKREWCVMLFGGPHAPPASGPYTFRIRARDPRARFAAAKGTAAPQLEHAAALWDQASQFAAASRLLEPDTRRGYVFGATFLLAEDAIAPFRKLLERLATAALGAGISTYLEGPRPPFTFI